MPNRNGQSDDYRYGFGGHEKDDEIKGNGNQISFGDYGYSPRVGRRWIIDPEATLLPQMTPYIYALDNPINVVDPDGEFPIFINGEVNVFFSTVHFSYKYRASKDYWNKNLLKDMVDSYDYKLGTEKNHNSNSRQSSFSGDFLFVDGDIGSGFGKNGDKKDRSSSSSKRKEAGVMQAKVDANKIWEKLVKGLKTGEKIKEKIQIVTHSKGSHFGNGYVEQLKIELQERSEITGIGFAYNEDLVVDLVVHLSPHQSGSLNVSKSKTTTISVHNQTDVLSGSDAKGDISKITTGGGAHGNGSFAGGLKKIFNWFKSKKSTKYEGSQDILPKPAPSKSMPSPNGCFVAGTLILMADGQSKRIEDVKVGDSVKTFNLKLGKIENNKVLKIISPFNDELITISFSNNLNNTNSTEHPYYVKGKGWASFNPNKTKQIYGWEVSQLEIGDICLMNLKNMIHEIKITSIIKDNVKSTKTYNLSSIENNTNYFANTILVHNKVLKQKLSIAPVNITK